MVFETLLGGLETNVTNKQGRRWTISTAGGTETSLLETTLTRGTVTFGFTAREVNSQSSTIKILTIEGIKGSLSFFMGSELNEGETFRLTIVLGEFNISNGTIFTEGLS
jgi:hypothetical protein